MYTGRTGRPDAMSTAIGRRQSEARQRATYQDVLDAPTHQVAEIVDGVLYATPRPAMPRALASSLLGSQLIVPFHLGRGGPGGWWIVGEPELHLGDDILVPDLAGWRRTRMPTLSRDGVLHTCAGLGLRDPLAIDPQARPRRQAPGVRSGGCASTCGSSTPPDAPSKRSSSPQGIGRGSRLLLTTSPCG